MNGTSSIYGFGEFRMDLDRRILLRNGHPVTVAPKCFETLALLVESGGSVLEKDDLLKSLWPDSFVEEANLTQNIFVLRKILGDDRNGHSFIQTIPRRGYKFVATVTPVEVTENGHSGYWNRHSPFRG